MLNMIPFNPLLMDKTIAVMTNKGAGGSAVHSTHAARKTKLLHNYYLTENSGPTMIGFIAESNYIQDEKCLKIHQPIHSMYFYL